MYLWENRYIFFFLRTQAEKMWRPLHDYKGFDVCTCNYFTNYCIVLKQYFTPYDYWQLFKSYKITSNFCKWIFLLKVDQFSSSVNLTRFVKKKKQIYLLYIIRVLFNSILKMETLIIRVKSVSCLRPNL